MAECPDYTQATAVIRSFDPTSNSMRTTSIGSLVDFNYNNFKVDYSDPLKEIYRFYLDLVLVGTIELVYSDASKVLLLEGRKY